MNTIILDFQQRASVKEEYQADMQQEYTPVTERLTSSHWQLSHTPRPGFEVGQFWDTTSIKGNALGRSPNRDSE